MNQRTFLELTHNPFTPPREGFFSGADRQTHLDHIRHLNQWSRRILLVSGPFGIGKSTLYRELSNSLEASAKAARLSGAVVTSEREILLGLAQGFGVAIAPDLHIDELIDLLRAHIEEENEKQKQCAVFVDDAQLLEFAAISSLFRLASVAPLRMVLFAEATIVANVTKAAKKHEIEWFEIRLTGFPAAEVRGYLEWRFAQAQYRGRLPFTDQQVERIVQRSGGNPNVVDFMANELLADLETGDFRAQKSKFPRRHVLLAAVLVVLVGLLYQLYQTPTPPQAEVVADAGMDAPDIEAQANVGAEVSEESASPSGIDSPVTPVLRLSETEQAIDLSEEITEEIPEESPETSPEVAQEEPTNLEELIEEEPEAESKEELEVEPAATEPAPVVTQQPTNIQQDGDSNVRGAEFLLRQNPQHYTLQLLTLSSRENAEAFIGRQADAEEFAIYRITRNERLLYVVTYGVFSSRSAAQSRAGNLSGELASIEPWVRPLSLVQDAIRSNLQG